jgi:hypothetical protein
MDRPSDACPYSRPFPPNFRECPAFQPRQFIPLDTLYQPLDPVLTCRHLLTRSLPERHRWYAACALGDAQARRLWAERLGAARLERIRLLQAQLSQAMMPYTARLWSLKGQQLRAYRDQKDARQITSELRVLAASASQDVDLFLLQKREAFSRVEMPVEAARQLIKSAFDRFIDSRYASEISFEVPDNVLEQFPPAVRSFFRPSPEPAATP